MTDVNDRKNRIPTVLCILDGWGEREESEANAVAIAHTPVWDRMSRHYPHARLDASEAFVGLPSGQMGNSEVGHMNIGAGRVVLQDLPRIDTAFDEGALASLSQFRDFTAALKASGGTAHVAGLLSPGGVHAHQRHMAALADALIAEGIPVKVHAFLDGRDTPPKSAAGFIETFQAEAPDAPIATVAGRFFAMDRDKRWDRVEKAYDLLVSGTGDRADTAKDAVAAAYAADRTDEFVPPTAIAGHDGMKDGDGLLFANFRADRAREILAALGDPAFDGFPRKRTVDFAAKLGMISYSTDLDALYPALFPPEDLADVLGAVVAEKGLTQLRIAETEKYAHVTFFLNGGREEPFAGETRILVPSPDVETYDLKPEMSAPEVTDKLVDAIDTGAYDLIVVNFANTDMVGHTGNLDAARKAVEAVDRCLGRLENAVLSRHGAMLVTADHGNAEMMTDPETGEPHTAHTLNRVPLILVADEDRRAGVTLSDGRLADLAPSILTLMGIEQPAAMTGHSLISRRNGMRAAE